MLSLVVLAACGSHAGPGTADVKPTGPAPSVATQAEEGGGDFSSSFTSTGLPAISGDGKNVVLAVIGEDGARGAPNLAVVEKDRDDTIVQTLAVQTANEGEAMAYGDGEVAKLPAATTERLAAANRFLTESHAKRGWLPLGSMTLDEAEETEGDGYGGLTRRAQAGDIAIEWDEGKVKVTVAGKVVVDRTTTGWTAKPTPMCDECDLCENPSFLSGAWIDAERKLIVAVISFRGNDSCWEPDSAEHVVAW